MKKSHIQLPKGQMKPFSSSDTGRTVFKLDIQSKKINVSRIKSIDTELGYYSDSNEMAMNIEYESRFFYLRQRVVDLFNGKCDIVDFDDNDRKTIINYVNLAIVRSRSTLDSINIKSVWAQIHGGFSHNEVLNAKLNGILKTDFYVDYAFIVVKNNSDLNFVLPSNSYYFTTNIFKQHLIGEFLIFIPITPLLAFVMIPFKDNKKFLKSHENGYFPISDNIVIERLNICALETELFFDRKFIISKTKDELEMLVNNY